MNADDPAFGRGIAATHDFDYGITIRAYMATKFAAAIVGNSYVAEMMGEAKKHMTPQQQHDFDNKIAPLVTSKAAAALADALIAQLSNP